MARLIGLQTETDALRNLDFLRFVASVGIVVYHSNEFFFPPEQRALIIAQQGFGLYVDLFFMISGFVLAYVYAGRISNLRRFADFMWRRIARIYPLHLVVLAVNIVVWAVLLTRGESATAPSFAPGCITQTALLVQEYFDCGSPYMFNGVTWSISIEMGLYILFPLIASLAMLGPIWIGTVCLLFTLTAAFLLPEYKEWGHLPHLLRGLVSFPIGVFLYRIRDRLPDLKDRGYVMLGLSALVFIEMCLPIPSWVTMLTILVLFVVAVTSDHHGNVSVLVAIGAPLGQLTYAIYIWHRVIILVFMNVIADKLMPGNLPVLLGMSLLSYATIFGLSYWGYLWIERPARKALTAVPERIFTGVERRVR
ncbi:acyltransferase [Aliiroseovarius sp. KMU-50]|uniref:Acyltransferase n=1 Tax=Aliiroseovarius salicola TaxID=3009082 RepID=A0ABT4VXT7_9RHOB|nr:acyltransferase [Aliiroseovarius sp. KMU-50]MDA5093076.1 acyltransferase [Aliiroseovarius sp. KMU-50]